MSTHVQAQSPLMSLSSAPASAAQAGSVAAQPSPMAGIRGVIARLGHSFMAALIASRAAHALAEIEAYDHRIAADLRAAMDRGERPFDY